ncbi:MAG: hypothetical protein JNJ77_08785 [Planctomycetia bacterium]|nr:hypothetical protein [Planctomycetia bacterium]
MNSAALTKSVGELVDHILADSRWVDENDELGASILGMLMYGFALTAGRTMMLELTDIDAVIFNVLTKKVGTAAKWTHGLIEEARKSAFDESYHPGNFELIGVGHSYNGEPDQNSIVNNIFANIQSIRQASC